MGSKCWITKLNACSSANPQNVQPPCPHTKWYWNTHNPSIWILKHCSWFRTVFYPPYQTTEDKMQPNHPTPESYSPRTRMLTKKILMKLNRSLIWSKLGYGFFIQEVIRMSYLPELETIHQQELHITLGAFTTSQIKSLYIEVNEHPLS